MPKGREPPWRKFEAHVKAAGLGSLEAKGSEVDQTQRGVTAPEHANKQASLVRVCRVEVSLAKAELNPAPGESLDESWQFESSRRSRLPLPSNKEVVLACRASPDSGEMAVASRLPADSRRYRHLAESRRRSGRLRRG
ncbi:hypothetical protein DFH09DRAFT_1284056, partial [Mycena vulgaris]